MIIKVLFLMYITGHRWSACKPVLEEEIKIPGANTPLRAKLDCGQFVARDPAPDRLGGDGAIGCNIGNVEKWKTVLRLHIFYPLRGQWRECLQKRRKVFPSLLAVPVTSPAL